MARRDTTAERRGAQQVRRRMITQVVPDKRNKEREKQIQKDIRGENY
jgi:hypothetical protein